MRSPKADRPLGPALDILLQETVAAWNGELKVLEEGAFGPASSIARVTAMIAQSYPPIAEDALLRLTFSICLLNDAVVLADDIMDYSSDNNQLLSDIPRYSALFAEACSGFCRVLGSEGPFWEAFQGYFSEYAAALRSEAKYSVSEDWAFLSEDDCITIARGKNGLVRVIDAAISCAAGVSQSGMADALLDYFIANQMLDDLKDWREDIRCRRPSLLLKKVSGWPSTSSSRSSIGTLIYTSGAASSVVSFGAERLQIAETVARGCGATSFAQMAHDRRRLFDNYVEALEREMTSVVRRLPRRSDADSDAGESLRRGLRFIFDVQDGDGAWRDFFVDAGIADSWTTGYVGEAVISACTPPMAGDSLEAAAQFLQAKQAERGAWGYNDTIPIDADSTAWALLFLGKLGVFPEEPRRLLMLHRDPKSGGFKSYNCLPHGSTWQLPHVDVSAAVAKALSFMPDESSASLLEFLERSRDGFVWQSFWWSTPLYATAQVLEAMNSYGRLAEYSKIADGIIATVSDYVLDDDPFTLAHSIDIACLLGDVERAHAWSDNVMRLQKPDGSWRSKKPTLRYANFTIDAPWNYEGHKAGRLVYDQRSLFTTATVVRALSRLHGRLEA